MRAPVFGGKTDEEHQADLRVNIASEIQDSNGRYGAKHGNGHRHNDRQRDNPTFIKANEEEVSKNNCQA